MGLNLISVNLIMGCLQSASFVVLINGSPSHFFKASRGLQQGCPLYPFPFLIIVEALSIILKEVGSNGSLRGIKVSESEMVSHMLFVDDVFCNVFGSLRDVSMLKIILDQYCRARRILINLEKSCILINNCSKA